MVVDGIEPELKPPAFIRLQQCLQGNLPRLTEQHCGIDPIRSGIQAPDFDEIVERLKFPHTAPFHCGCACIVNGITAAVRKNSSDHPGKHGFVHLRLANLLDVPCKIE